MNFSRCPLSERFYGGSEKKLGILVDKVPYMLKFQKKTAFGSRFNHVSEYIGSHVFEALGFCAHKTILGEYKGQMVVACRDFNVDDVHFVPFNDVGESTLDQDKEQYQYDYEDIMQMLRDNSKLTNVAETISAFWEIYMVDALLGNFDRHGANWGFLKKNDCYSLAPVFDNGSCLFPNITEEEEMLRIMESEEETDKRIFKFPTSQIKLNKKKSSYFEVIHSLEFTECNQALEKIFQRIEMENIYRIIDETPYISQVRKEFYKHMIHARYEKIIKASYEKMKGGCYA